MKIDFMLIGSGRSGSSWIYQCLKEHPRICLETPAKGMPISYFGDDVLQRCSQNQIKGWSARYLRRAEEIAPLIAKDFPNIKLIANLRNPIERLYSHYLMEKSEGTIDYSFDDFIAKKDEPIKTGFYYSQLLTFLKFFPEDKVLILIYEDIEKNPLEFIQKIYKFIGANSDFIPSGLNKKVYPTTKNRLFFPFFSQTNLEKVKNFLKNSSRGKKLICLSRNAKISSFVYFLLNKNSRAHSDMSPSLKPIMNQKTRKYLQEIYQEEIKNLEKLITRDLSIWR